MKNYLDKPLIQDAGEDFRFFEGVRINYHVLRQANNAADWMAHCGYYITNSTYWFDSPDTDFSITIFKDVLGWPSSWDPP